MVIPPAVPDPIGDDGVKQEQRCRRHGGGEPQTTHIHVLDAPGLLRSELGAQFIETELGQCRMGPFQSDNGNADELCQILVEQTLRQLALRVRPALSSPFQSVPPSLFDFFRPIVHVPGDSVDDRIGLVQLHEKVLLFLRRLIVGGGNPDFM